MLSRRDVLKALAATASAYGLGIPSLAANPPSLHAGAAGGFRRVVFFLQNHGFDRQTCLPQDLGAERCALDTLNLQMPMELLEPYKNRMQVVTGLNGSHASPNHSAYYGALGGYRGGYGVPPVAPTIDSVLARHLPPSLLGHLAIGFHGLSDMKSRPTVSGLSARGPGKPVFMDSNPNLLYRKIFGSIMEGQSALRYNVDNNLYQFLESVVEGQAQGLPDIDGGLFSHYVEGYQDMNLMRERLATIPDLLKQYAPPKDDRYEHPEFETDWHGALLEIGLAALKAQLTNVLTIGSGRGTVSGSWKGIGVEQSGHSLGHNHQLIDDWVKIRQYNTQMLVKIIQELESVPEGDGTMMDHTLIIYTSNNGKTQHTDGGDWSYVLLGDGGGTFATGSHIHGGDRPINDLYATLLRGAGQPVDRFNDAGNSNSRGPMDELLA